MGDKISQYTADGASNPLKDEDLFDASNEDGAGSFDLSKKITALELLAYINANIDNLYSTDGSIPNNREVVLNSKILSFIQGDIKLKSTGGNVNFVLESSVANKRVNLKHNDSLDSGGITLSNSAGDFFTAEDGVLTFNVNDLYAESGFVGINNSVQIGTEVFRVNGESILGSSIINGVGMTVDGAGSTNARNFAVQNNTDGKYFVATSDAGDGRIGINVLNPDSTKRLHVVGDTRIDGTQFLNNQSAPATPTGGGIIYVESGALKYIGSSGTITTLANA